MRAIPDAASAGLGTGILPPKEARSAWRKSLVRRGSASKDGVIRSGKTAMKGMVMVGRSANVRVSATSVEVIEVMTSDTTSYFFLIYQLI